MFSKKTEFANFEIGDEKKLIAILKSGGVGILPTDTLYGVVGSALSPTTVERMYVLRKRELSKPFIVLLSGINDLKMFDIALTTAQRKILKKLWPAKVSVILGTKHKKFAYLHRGSGAIAFRVPADESLRKFLKKTGPLVAPSANLAGANPSLTIGEAKKYFKDRVDFYVDSGKIKSKPSTLVMVDAKGGVQTVREGAVKINSQL